MRARRTEGLVPHLPSISSPQAAGEEWVQMVFRWGWELRGTPDLSYNKDTCVGSGDTCSSSDPKQDLRHRVVTVIKNHNEQRWGQVTAVHNPGKMLANHAPGTCLGSPETLHGVSYVQTHRI